MANILCIETSTKVCSVALFKDEEMVALKEQSSDQYIHSEKLAVFINEVISEAGMESSHLDAVAVSSGPGSYTGLRIGTATAKGFGFGVSIPLISVDTLRSLAESALQCYPEYSYYIPMIDARRLEVYTSVYNAAGDQVIETHAHELDESSFLDVKGSKVLLIGDGAEKSLGVLGHLAPDFKKMYCSAQKLGKLALEKYQRKEFEDLAYYEPHYLKDFVAGRPKKLL